jgi:hypothetical protein
MEFGMARPKPRGQRKSQKNVFLNCILKHVF